MKDVFKYFNARDEKITVLVRRVSDVTEAYAILKQIAEDGKISQLNHIILDLSTEHMQSFILRQVKE